MNYDGVEGSHSVLNKQVLGYFSGSRSDSRDLTGADRVSMGQWGRCRKVIGNEARRL